MLIQNSLKINIDRLWKDIYDTAQIGKGKSNGISRLTLSESDKEVRSEFISLCRKENLKIRIDKFGNIFAIIVPTGFILIALFHFITQHGWG